MQILGLILLTLLCGVSLIAMFTAINLLLPVPVDRAQQRLEKSLSQSFLIGLVNIVFFTAIVALCIYLGQLAHGGPLASIPFLLGLLILGGLAIFTLLGLTAMAKLLGERIGKTGSPTLSHMRGGLLLLLACLTPYIGWCLFTPVILCFSIGAGLLTLSQRKPASVLE